MGWEIRGRLRARVRGASRRAGSEDNEGSRPYGGYVEIMGGGWCMGDISVCLWEREGFLL